MADTSSMKMQGVIVGEIEGGFVADMTHPERLEGVSLPLGGLCLTRDYPNQGARTRVTQHHVPCLEVRTGDPVVAVVEMERDFTGRMAPNPAYSRNWDAPQRIPETEVVAGVAKRWGVKS